MRFTCPHCQKEVELALTPVYRPSVDDVVALRDATNLSLRACARALEVSKGDVEKATAYLRNEGLPWRGVSS